MLINENITNSHKTNSLIKKGLSLFMLLLFSIILQGNFASNSAVAKPIDISKYSISNGFYVKDRVLKFKETVRGITCRGTIHYPYMTNDAEDVFIEINDEIHDFAEIYSVCNEADKDNYSVSYKIPESHLKDFFSVVWYTKKDNKLWRIDALTFDRDQGDLAKINEIFNSHAKLLYGKIVELSEGHLSAESDWEEFTIKIKRRDIQIYVEHGVWMIVFNSTPELDKLVYKELPKDLLVSNDVTDAR